MSRTGVTANICHSSGLQTCVGLVKEGGASVSCLCRNYLHGGQNDAPDQLRFGEQLDFLNDLGFRLKQNHLMEETRL